MKCKKIIFAFVLLGAVIGGITFSSGVANAQTSTVEQLQAQISQLLARIAQLQQQVAHLQGEPVSWCHSFQANLRFEMTGEEVHALQLALQKEGFDVGNEIDDRRFGERTASAVVGFQQKYQREILSPYGLSFGTGFVGTTTRAKLNGLYGCSASTPPDVPVTVTPPQPPVVLPSPPVVQPQPPAEIPPPFITVFSPKTGQEFLQGDVYEVNWQSNGVGEQVKVTVCMTLDSYEQSRKIAARCSLSVPVPNTGIYSNTFGRAAVVGDYTAKVEDATNSSVYGTSGMFHVAERVEVPDESSLTILSPNGGEQLVAGQPANITWQFSGVSDERIQIALGLPNGDTPFSVTNIQASSQKYVWTIPSNIPLRNDYRIVIRKVAPSYTLLDSSDGYFSITSSSVIQPSIKVLAPNGGEKIQFGSAFYVVWSSTGFQKGDNAYIYLKFLDGATCLLAERNILDGSQPITVPENMQCTNIPRSVVSGEYTILVVTDNESVRDTSDGNISFVSPVSTSPVTLLSPNGGESWRVGETKTISWAGGSLARDNAIQLIDASVPSTATANYSFFTIKEAKNKVGSETSFSWRAGEIAYCPACALNGLQIPPGEYKIRIVGPDGKYDDSDTSFSLLAPNPPPITVTSPNGGETFSQGQELLVQWKYSDPQAYAAKSILVELWRGKNFISSSSLVSGSKTSYSYNTTNLTEGTDYWVRVLDFSTRSYSDRSDGSFSIVAASTPSITLLSPIGDQQKGGGEQWMVGGTYPITWQSQGVDKVKLQVNYSGVLFAPIASGVDASAGSYMWTIPANFFELYSSFQEGKNFTISVIREKPDGAYDYSVQDESPGYFEIVSSEASAEVCPNPLLSTKNEVIQQLQSLQGLAQQVATQISQTSDPAQKEELEAQLQALLKQIATLQEWLAADCWQ